MGGRAGVGRLYWSCQNVAPAARASAARAFQRPPLPPLLLPTACRMALDDFYARLPTLAHFADGTDPERYTALPPTWTVLVADVEGSTAAVQAGRYRDVNYLGAAAIAAVLNLAGDTEVPFVFGGDGASLVVPPSLLGAASAALAALRQHAAERFGMTLRVGAVPVRDLEADGHRVRVARLAVSPNYTQALFTGGGLAHADHLVKADETAARYAIPDGPDVPSKAEEADSADPYEGLECRWQDVPSAAGETVSLLVTARGPSEAARHEVYRAAVEAVEAVYGSADDGRAPHPIAPQKLRLSTDPRRFSPELRLRTEQPRRLRQRLRLWALNLIGTGLIWRKTRTSETDWAQYPTLLREATDFRKFDDTLRMVLAGTAAQRERLEALLEARYQAGELVYGLHVSDRAVLTCLVHERMGRQVHFVDGAEGGYTSAADAMKRRARALALLPSDSSAS